MIALYIMGGTMMLNSVHMKDTQQANKSALAGLICVWIAEAWRFFF